MRLSTFRAALLLAVSAAVLPEVGLAVPAPDQAVGPEIPVGERARVGMAADGSYVLVTSELQRTTQSGRAVSRLYAQRYFPDGSPIGVRLNVSEHEVLELDAINLAVKADGDFSVAWDAASVADDDEEFPERDVEAFRYSDGSISYLPVSNDSDGNPSDVSDDEVGGRVAIGGNGNLVFAWQAFNDPAVDVAEARLYGNQGLTGVFRLDSRVSLDSFNPEIAAAADGSFVAVWHINSELAEPASGVYFRRYGANGAALGPETLVAATGLSESRYGVALAPSGNFAIAWSLGGQVYARLYAPSGAALGAAFRLDEGAVGPNDFAAIASDAEGNFLVAWNSGSRNIRARRFSYLGQLQGAELLLASRVTDSLNLLSLGMDADGDFIITARSTTPTYPYPSTYFMRRFAGPQPVDISLQATGSPAEAEPESLVAYQLRVRNLTEPRAPSGIAELDGVIGTATGIIVDTALPMGFQYQGVSGTDWGCDQASGVFRCTYSGVLAPGAESAFTISARASAPAGAYTLSAFASGQQYDPDEDEAGTDNEASTTTSIVSIGDDSPDPFAFAPVSGALIDVWVESAPATITGIDVSAAVSVSGAGFPECKVNGGAWMSAGCRVANGDSLRLRLRSAPTGSTARVATASIGGVAAGFSVTTVAADMTPDPFSFPEATGAPREAEVTSSVVTISGINLSVPVGLGGSGAQYASYRINGAGWTTAGGSIRNGDTLQLRMLSSPDFGTLRSVNVTVGDGTAQFRVRTIAADVTPDPIVFLPVRHALPDSQVESNVVTIRGVNAPVPVQLVTEAYNFKFRVNGGNWRDTPRTVSNGDTVQVRLRTSPTPGNVRVGVLEVGGIRAEFSARTLGNDATPEQIVFPSVFYAPLDVPVESNVVTVTGIDQPVSVTPNGAGLSYRINGSPWTTSAGELGLGDTLQLRLRSSPKRDTARSASISVGTVSASFLVRTEGSDGSPNPFSFPQVTEAPLNTLMDSAIVTISGIDQRVPVSVNGANLLYRINGGPWLSSPGTLTNGDTLQLQLLSSGKAQVTRSGSVQVGGVSAEFRVRTSTPDITPDTFSFPQVNNAPAGTAILSNVVTITGINAPVPVSVSGAGLSYRIDGGVWTTAGGMLVAGKQLQLKLASSPNPGVTRSGIVTVSGTSVEYRVRTAP